MLEFLFKKQRKINRAEEINSKFEQIKKIYCKGNIKPERKEELYGLIEQYGYLPYSQNRALE